MQEKSRRVLAESAVGQTDLAQQGNREVSGLVNRREQMLERVKDIVLGEIGGANVKVYLFGSWARGEERRSSDIDIALDWVGGAPPDRLVRLREVLEESDVPFRVDVVDLASAGEVLASKVGKEGVLWKG